MICGDDLQDVLAALVDGAGGGQRHHRSSLRGLSPDAGGLAFVSVFMPYWPTGR